MDSTDDRGLVVGSTKEPLGIDYFGRGHWLTKIHVASSLRVRRRMFEIFCAYAGELRGLTVLDVGATPDTERCDSNCMIPWLLERGARVILYSPENIDNLASRFPEVKILHATEWKAAGVEHRFDWAISSAVLEHVGSRACQVSFLRDLADRSRGLFVTTPARFHWMEFHTKIPLIHWLPKPMHRAILRRLGRRTWAKEAHLNLLSKGDFSYVARSALEDEFAFELRSTWFGGMPSNHFLLARHNEA